MPKRKRTEKEVVKLSAAAGKATGQKTITQSMFRPFSSSQTPVVEDNAELEAQFAPKKILPPLPFLGSGVPAYRQQPEMIYTTT